MLFWNAKKARFAAFSSAFFFEVALALAANLLSIDNFTEK